MTQPKKYILIHALDLLSGWPEALCTDHATALYYLAQEAARLGLPLRHDQRGNYYHIGQTQYDLLPLPLLDIDAVNQYRRRHERTSR